MSAAGSSPEILGQVKSSGKRIIKTERKVFHEAEKNMIVKRRAEYKHILDDGDAKPAKKAAVWKQITEDVNAIGIHVRNSKSVIKCWSNMNSEYKAYRKSGAKTGGGPPDSMKPFMKVMDRYNMHMNTAIAGVTGGVEFGSGRVYSPTKGADPMLASGLKDEVSDTDDENSKNEAALSDEEQFQPHLNESLGSIDSLSLPHYEFSSNPRQHGTAASDAAEASTTATSSALIIPPFSLKRKNGDSFEMNTKEKHYRTSSNNRQDASVNRKAEFLSSKNPSRPKAEKVSAESISERVQLSIEVLETDLTVSKLRLENEKKKAKLIDIEISNAQLISRKLKVENSLLEISFNEKAKQGTTMQFIQLADGLNLYDENGQLVSTTEFVGSVQRNVTINESGVEENSDASSPIAYE